MLTIENILTRANLDVDQQNYLYENVLTGWDTGSPDLIRILESPMNSGKTTTMLMATVWRDWMSLTLGNVIAVVIVSSCCCPLSH